MVEALSPLLWDVGRGWIARGGGLSVEGQSARFRELLLSTGAVGAEFWGRNGWGCGMLNLWGAIV